MIQGIVRNPVGPKREVKPRPHFCNQAEGHSLRQIAANLGVGYGTVRERLRKERAKTPRKRRCGKPTAR
jgi:transposase